MHGTTSRKHRRIEHQPSFHFAEQLQPGFSCLLSSGSDSALYSNFLCYFSGSSSRIVQCSTNPALLPWRRPVEANSFPWAVLCVVDSLSLILVGHSKGKTHETMMRRQVHHTSTSNDFHAALFVNEYPRPLIDVCTIGNSLTLHTNLAEPQLSVELWVNKLSKSCQHFLNLFVKEKQLWQVNVLCPSMPLYGTLSLFRTSSAGCYAFPCVSLGCDVSTCKPNIFPRPKKKTATLNAELRQCQNIPNSRIVLLSERTISLLALFSCLSSSFSAGSSGLLSFFLFVASFHFFSVFQSPIDRVDPNRCLKADWKADFFF